MTAAAQSLWPPHVGGRTGQKVRRNSSPFEAGEAFFRPLLKMTVVHIMRGAERLAVRSMKARGRGRVKRLHAGELRLPDLHILHALLFECLDWKTGRCAPTYDDLAEKTGHARDTIAGALARLAKAGILERLRRFQRVEGADGKGPQVVQAPNAYRFALPARLRLLLGLAAGPPPIPDDAYCDARDARLSKDRMLTEETGQRSLGSALGKLQQAVWQRESSE
jgi:hypothetical protein